MILPDIDSVSDKTKELIAYLEDRGYETVFEFKPKVEWPKEGEPQTEDRYMFASVIPGEDVWIVVTDPSPEVAVSEVIRKLESYGVI